MSDVAAFTLKPPLRCSEYSKVRGQLVCGNTSRWMLPADHGLEPAYFCDEHFKDGCVIAPADAPFRRVSVTITVLLCGTSLIPAAAQREAVERLADVVGSIGGLVDVLSVSSTIGRFRPFLPAGKGNGERGSQG